MSSIFGYARERRDTFAMTEALLASAGLSQHPVTLSPEIERDRRTKAAEKAVILCIEDDAECSLLIQEELEERGWAVVVAHNGREGLAMLRSFQVDLVLCDVNMPQMSGFEVLEELNKCSERPSAPFVFLTGLADEESMIAGRRLGAADYLKKPVDFDALHALIGERLSRIAPGRWSLDEAPLEKTRGRGLT